MNAALAGIAAVPCGPDGDRVSCGRQRRNGYSRREVMVGAVKPRPARAAGNRCAIGSEEVDCEERFSVAGGCQARQPALKEIGLCGVDWGSVGGKGYVGAGRCRLQPPRANAPSRSRDPRDVGRIPSRSVFIVRVYIDGLRRPHGELVYRRGTRDPNIIDEGKKQSRTMGPWTEESWVRDPLAPPFIPIASQWQCPEGHGVFRFIKGVCGNTPNFVDALPS